jgi:hypothetical protein
VAKIGRKSKYLKAANLKWESQRVESPTTYNGRRVEKET